jgi:uncharacterized protein YqeY
MASAGGAAGAVGAAIAGGAAGAGAGASRGLRGWAAGGTNADGVDSCDGGVGGASNGAIDGIAGAVSGGRGGAPPGVGGAGAGGGIELPESSVTGWAIAHASEGLQGNLSPTRHAGWMALKAQLQGDLTAAMKARDQVTTSTLRMLLSAVSTAAVAGDAAVELTDDQVLVVLQSEAKKRAESAEIYAAAGRTESAAKERAELEIIARYLPAAISDGELQGLVDAAVAAAAAEGNTGPKAMGSVIKAVRDQAGPSADGGKIAAMVKAALA